MLRMQTTEATQQSSSIVKYSELPLLSQTCSLFGNWSKFLGLLESTADQHSHENLLFLVHLSVHTRRSYPIDQKLPKNHAYRLSNDSEANKDYQKRITVTAFCLSPVQQRPSRKTASQLPICRNMHSRKNAWNFNPPGAPHFGGS